MPVCTWCGIESKSDLVCDWCKRPLALRSLRKSDGRSQVDILKDGDDDRTALTPRVMAVAAVVALCLIFVVAWALGARGSGNSSNDAVASAASPEFVAQRDSAFTGRAANPPAPTPAPAQSVFLPAAMQSSKHAPTADEQARPGQQPIMQPGHVSLVLTDEERQPANSAGPSVRLTAGVLKSQGGRRGISVGHVTITNTTENNVVDFRLEAVINGHTYTLQPFEGTLERPRNMKSTAIEAGEKISVPVMVKGYNGGKKSNVVPARITMNAWLDSGPSVIKDELLTP